MGEKRQKMRQTLSIDFPERFGVRRAHAGRASGPGWRIRDPERSRLHVRFEDLRRARQRTGDKITGGTWFDRLARGVKFHSLTEAIDTATPTGRAMWQMIGVLAEIERSLI
jgi:hypothetical protein